MLKRLAYSDHGPVMFGISTSREFIWAGANLRRPSVGGDFSKTLHLGSRMILLRRGYRFGGRGRGRTLWQEVREKVAS